MCVAVGMYVDSDGVVLGAGGGDAAFGGRTYSSRRKEVDEPPR